MSRSKKKKKKNKKKDRKKDKKRERRERRRRNRRRSEDVASRTVRRPTQSVSTQVGLARMAGEQNYLNMRRGAQIDRENAKFFTGQDIRKVQAIGAETRLQTKTEGEEARKGYVTLGEQERLNIGARGVEDRALRVTEGEQERKNIAATGVEQRAGIRETGSETRKTDLQQEMFRRYKENRDYEQAQSAYRV